MGRRWFGVLGHRGVFANARGTWETAMHRNGQETDWCVFMVDPANYQPHYNIPLCDELRSRGVDIKLVTSRFAYETLCDASREYVHNWFYRMAGRLRATGRMRQVLCAVEHLIDWTLLLRELGRVNQPVVLHSQWLPLPSVDRYALRIARRLGAALVHTVHNLKPNAEQRGSVRQYVALYRQADCLLVHTEHTVVGLIEEFAIPQERIWRTPFGVPLEGMGAMGQEAARRVLGIEEGEAVALFFGALRREKGLAALLAAFGVARRVCPRAKLVIAGRPEGVSAAELEAARRAAGVPEERLIRVLRYIPREQVATYFCAADVVVCPYERADQSGVVTLSKAFGKATIVTDVGGLPEVVRHGVTGLVVARGSTEALGEALTMLLGDRELARQMGEAARAETAGELAWGPIAETTRNAYVAALRRRGVRV